MKFPIESSFSGQGAVFHVLLEDGNNILRENFMYVGVRASYNKMFDWVTALGKLAEQNHTRAGASHTLPKQLRGVVNSLVEKQVTNTWQPCTADFNSSCIPVFK